MEIIGEIASLGSVPSEDLQHTHQLTLIAKDIRLRLATRDSRIYDEILEMQDQYSGHPPHYIADVYNHYTTLVVTHVFACAAIIYLQITITPHTRIFHIQDPLQDVIKALRMIPDPRMVRGLVWPLCVAGCTAYSPSDQEFFRRISRGAVKDARNFGNSGKAVEILEKAWVLQEKEGRLIDCSICMRMSNTCLLLV